MSKQTATERSTIAMLKRHINTDTPKCEFIEITPTIAAWLLEYNWDENRKLQQSTVDRYAEEIKHGHWDLTGEPITISRQGRIINGQHRLWAVVEAEKPIETAVMFGIDESVFPNIDGAAPRSIAFRTSMSSQKSAALNFIIKIGYGQPQCTASNIIILDRVYGDAIDAIIALQSRQMRVIRQAPVVAAAALWIRAGHGGYVKDVYAALVGLDSSALPPIGKSFLKQVVIDGAAAGRRAVGGTQLFIRAFKTFDSSYSQVRRLQFKDGTGCLDVARTMIERAMAESRVDFSATRITTKKRRRAA